MSQYSVIDWRIVSSGSGSSTQSRNFSPILDANQPRQKQILMLKEDGRSIPSKQSQWIRAQYKAYRARFSSMLNCVSCARGFPLLPPFKSLSLFDGNFAFDIGWFRRNSTEVEMDSWIMVSLGRVVTELVIMVDLCKRRLARLCIDQHDFPRHRPEQGNHLRSQES